MLKLQKLLLNLVAILLLGSAAALVVQNLDLTQTNVQFLGGTLIDLSLGALMALAGALVGGALLLKARERTLELGTQYKKVNRDLERKDVSREEAESKVKVLESKVETLEKALSAAIKGQTPK
ncbi:hypothetical protein [Vampirovibrio sp.]|uniref:hypothetical protein n=1 Tax=Vampirovibrio sp. TaxID=2717857 RepID=UPI003593F448